MKIVWDWSLSHEAERLLEMSLKIKNGFYHLHHFLPLPFNLKNKHKITSHHVYLPDLPYTKIPRYWESAGLVGESYPLKQLTSISDQLVHYLSLLKLPSLDEHQVQPEAAIYLPQVINWLRHTFPQLPLPKTIQIHPSYFGTSGSFIFNQESSTVTLYLRNDQGLYSLVEILLTALLRPHAGETLYTDWEKTEYLVDYLLLESNLKELFPNPNYWTPTTIPPHYSQSILKESADFVKKIGLSNHSECQFSLVGNTICFNKIPLTDFNPSQYTLLKALIARSPAPLTIDEIADLIFTKYEKFSLSAIGKTIERLRKKLTTLGISSSYIATASGVGYYLKN